jgi:hypothetical protein
MAIERDLILRMIEDVARAVARAAALLAGGKTREARAEVEEAAASVAGVDLRLAEVLDARLLADRLGDPRRIEALALVVEARADVARAEEDGPGEGAWRAKAVALRAEASRRAPR